MQAETPVMDGFKKGPANWAAIDACGLAVGLPDGVMGNSEVGHLTIGAGQVEFQDLVRINLCVDKGALGTQASMAQAFETAKKGTGRLHLFGLLSDGGVHSHQKHLYTILGAAKAAGVPRTFVHACLDGRDTPPTSGPGYVRSLEAEMAKLGYGEIATLSGRYYSMDRDKRWERVQLGYDCMCRPAGACETVPKGTLGEYVEAKHAAGETDEFVKPCGVLADGGIGDSDVFLCFNFRSDRAREMFEAISVEPPFETAVRRTPALCVSFTAYNAAFKSPIVFPPQKLANGLSEWISKKRLTQYHVAETEKYAHITFFFNGGREEPFEGEERGMVPSPKCATYDLEPEMNAVGVADAMVEQVASGKHTFLMCNFAPPDMVGHTGKLDKAIIAAAHTDEQIGKIAAACQEHGVALFVTSDHGNCETMLTAEGNPMTSHSTTQVPFVALLPKGDAAKFTRVSGGVADVAPTMLKYMGISIPEEMTGSSML
jgi:2,3-bisphosphoglycerate-independent phosphoglycerate mutase